MSENEQLIWVDKEDKVLGVIARDQVHLKESLKLHREAMGHLWKDEMKTSFWLQKRSNNKVQFPGYWTLATTCHVLWSDMDSKDELGYVRAIEREAPEEIGVETKGAELLKVVEMRTQKNWSMSGIVVGIADGIPRPDRIEVDEVKLFDRESIMPMRDKLTPNAIKCLIILGILNEVPNY